MATMNSNQLIVEKPIAKGDTLLWVSSLDNPASKKEIVVDKVGRKWLTIVNGGRNWKADIATLQVDCDRGYGYCFRSEAELTAAVEKYYQELAAQKAWEKLQRKIRDGWRKPDHLTEEAILQAMAALGWSDI